MNFFNKRNFGEFVQKSAGEFMEKGKKVSRKKDCFRILTRLGRFLPTVLFVLLIFAFDTADAVAATLIAAIIHEAGHAAVWLSFSSGRITGFRAAYNGFRMKGRGLLSYGKELAVIAAGPIANLLAFALFLPLAPFFRTFAWINLLTALSNLLPVDGYDGRRLLETALRACGKSDEALHALSLLCSATVAVSSLYFIGRANGGYWLFGIFCAGMLREMRERLP